LRLEGTALASSTREYGPARSVWIASRRHRQAHERHRGQVWNLPLLHAGSEKTGNSSDDAHDRRTSRA